MRTFPPLQTLAALAAFVFLLLGVLGFADGDVFGDLRLAVLLNLVHLAIGLAGVMLARTAKGAREFLVGSGIVCLAIWFLGVAALGGWLALGEADNWLHFLLGVGLIGLVSVATRRAEPTPA